MPDQNDEPSTNGDGTGGQECFKCGDSGRLERVGGVFICADCVPDTDDAPDTTYRLWGGDVDFSEPGGHHIPETIWTREQWMGQKKGAKTPFAPWADADAPVKCERESCTKHDEPVAGCGSCEAHADDDTEVTCADCNHDARYKWGFEGNYVNGETVEMALDDPRLGGRAYLQQEYDPIAHIDGDNVRDPDTGEIHPEFIDILNRIGASFVEISQSGAGIHVIYEGELPDGLKVADWTLQDEPFGDNDDPPSVEFYHRRRVLVVTGDHVTNTPETVEAWNTEAVREVIKEYEDPPELQEDNDASTDREDYDLEGYTPDVTERGETTTDIRDIFAALDRIDARDVAEDTIVNSWNKSANTSEGYRAFDPAWGSTSNGTANIVNDKVWQDTGDRAGYGTPVVMALIDAGEMSPERADPRRAKGELWWKGVEHLRKLGYDIPEYVNTGSSGDDKQAVSMSPVDAIESFDHSEYRRYVKRRGADGPTVEEVRDRLQEEMMEAVMEGGYSTIDAPTGAGKTHAVVSTPWKQLPEVTDGRPVIHASATTDARDDAAEMAAEADVDYYKLRSRSETCPLAAGDCDPGNGLGNPEVRVEGQPVSEWIDHMCDALGFPYSLVHQWLEAKLDTGVICEHDGECPSKSIFDGVPRDESGNPSHDVILCTHQFLHVPGLRNNTIVFVDEKPDFSGGVEPDILRRSVNQYLSWSDAPVDTFSDLVTANRVGCEPEHAGKNQVGGVMMNEYKKGFADRMDDALSEDPDRDWFQAQNNVHAHAPAFARAVWDAEESADGRYASNLRYSPPRLDEHAHDSSAWNRQRIRAVFTRDFEVAQIWMTPDFALADAVIGLDATAGQGMTSWRLNIHPDMKRRTILDPEERQKYRRHERGLITVQVGDNMNPVTRKRYVEGSVGRKAEAFLDHACNTHGDDLRTGVTSISGEPVVQQAMKDAGIEEPETMHYGNEESRNDFAGERFGYVLGAIDPGDEPVMNRIAALGLDAQPERVNPDTIDGDATCGTCEGDGCHDCSGTGLQRAYGRGFDGDDAETAQSVLNEVTQHHIVQSAGRYARDAEDPDDWAVVYIHTDRAPDSFIDIEVPDVKWTTSDDQRERLEYVRDADGPVTAREVAHACDCSKSAALDTLSTAADHGLLDVRERAGPHGAHLFAPNSQFSEKGSVDFGEGFSPDRIQHVSEHYTWTTAITSGLYPDVAGRGRGGHAVGPQAPLADFIVGSDPPSG